MELICLKPIYQERVWGGRALETKLGRTLPDDKPYGEAWEIVDRPEAQSRDVHSGRSLREWIESETAAVMGPDFDRRRTFPVLVKWLDCRERLSLQVHPPAAVADELEGEPKTENWYIADADEGASLIVGLKRGVTREQFAAALKEETLESLVHRFPVRRGASILVESGRLHAIDAGNLILEIQQNSDTTFRVYDWGRKGLDGKPRQLHVDQSLRSINFNDFEPSPREPFTGSGETILADSAEFRIREVHLDDRNPQLHLPGGEQPRIVSVVAGSIRDSESGENFRFGSNLIVPYCRETRFESSSAEILVTENFIPGT